MTTHDHPGEMNAPTDVEGEMLMGDPRAERLVGSPTADASGLPDVATDPGWQRYADQFAANRHRDDDGETASTRQAAETALFDGVDLEDFRGKWDNVQAGFVDDPKRCVEQADGLVSAVVEQLSSGLAEARSRLEQQWSRGEDASTEDLRVALKRYREFFDRLLAV